MASSIFQQRGSILTTIELEGEYVSIWEVEMRVQAENSNNSIIKRFFDLFLSFLLFIIVFSWLFPIIAMIIKITSKGPIFFKQQRHGLNGTIITCYKFRTMTATSPNLDDNGKYLQASVNDPRITKFGSFLRKTSLDELPQFWNVLRGDMSVIGPRPHPIELDKESEREIDNYMCRYLVKSGITGWAQVSGYRGPTQKNGLMKKRVEHDLWYIKNWSLLLDLRILLLTIKTAFWGDENAI